MGAPMSPDGRRVLPWPEMRARWCTPVHAPWRGGEWRRGAEASGAGCQLPNLGFHRGPLSPSFPPHLSLPHLSIPTFPSAPLPPPRLRAAARAEL